MNIKQRLEYIKKHEWYMQGGTIIPITLNIPYFSIAEELGYKNEYVFNKGCWNKGFFEKNEEKKKAKYYLKKYLRNPGFLDQRIKKWKEAAKRQNIIIKKIAELKPEREHELKKLTREYAKLSLNAWKLGIVIEPFDPWGHYFLELYTKKYESSDYEKSILTSPENLSFIQQERIDRYKIARSKNLEKVEEHYKKYYWYLNSWQDIEQRNEEHFKKKIQEDIKNLKNAKEEVETIIRHHKEIQREKKQLIKKYQFDKTTIKVFEFFSRLNDWRDERKKEGACKSNNLMGRIVNRFVKNNER